MYGCEIWTIKKAEHQRIDAFQLWCWRRLLRVSLISRSNQLILKGINPEYSLARLLKLKLQYFGCLMQRANSLEKTLVLGKTEGRRRREWQRMRCLNSITDSMRRVWVNSGSWRWTGRPGMLQSMGSQESDTIERLNWTDWWNFTFFHFLTVRNNAAQNIYTQVFVGCLSLFCRVHYRIPRWHYW